MRKFILLLAIAAIAGLPGKVLGQNTDNITASATAKILTAIEISKTTDLHFGTMVSTASEGTCTVSATSNERTQDGGVTLLTQTPTFSRAEFSVGGDANATYSITLPADETISISDGDGHSLSVDNFTHSAGVTPTLDESGEDDFFVGATLTVQASSTAGTYTGNFSITVAYN